MMSHLVTSSPSVVGFLSWLLPLILTGGVVAAIVTFFQNRWLEGRRAKEAERNRLRQSFAEAFAAYADYKEFPYAIRRRRADQAADERARLSAELTAIQSKLNYFAAWTQFESPSVGTAYTRLLSSMRKVAGTAMHDAWTEPPLSADADMNISIEKVDLRSLRADEEAYIQAVTTRLRELTPWSLRRR